MAISKSELIAKATRAYNFLVKWEQVSAEKRAAQNELADAEDTFQNHKKMLKTLAIGIVTIAVLAGLSDKFNLSTSGSIFKVFFVLFEMFGAFVGFVGFFMIIGRLLKIPGLKKNIRTAIKKLNVVEDNIQTLCGNMAQEISDTNEMFNGDYYPLARHVKYGIECLQSGRADDFKEMMNLIDDLKHREKLEAEARARTAAAQQAAADAAAARYSAERAASDAAEARRKLDYM